MFSFYKQFIYNFFLNSILYFTYQITYLNYPN
nr:MAG TPA: hypothetical protein [Bacteriophage sp.]